MHFRDSQLAYYYPVQCYLERNDLAGLDEFLRSHAELVTPAGLMENSMLHLACRYGSTKMTLLLREQLGDKAKILLRRTVGQDGWTPLHLAAVYGSPELMRTLTDMLGDEAADVIAIPLDDNTQATALHFAMSAGKTEVVEVLLQAAKAKAADVAAMPLGEEWTALHLAVHCGDFHMVKALIQAIGPDNARPMADVYLKSGMNILHLVATDCDDETAELVLDLLTEDMLYALSQAQVGELDNATPLNVAIQHGLGDMVKRILVGLRELAKPECRRRIASGWTAFMQVAYFGNVAMLQAMIQLFGKEIEPMIMQPFMQMKNATPFHMVLNRGNVAMTRAMVNAVDKSNHEKLLNLEQYDGTKPMNLAKRFWNDDILNVLLETGAVTG